MVLACLANMGHESEAVRPILSKAVGALDARLADPEAQGEGGEPEVEEQQPRRPRPAVQLRERQSMGRRSSTREGRDAGAAAAAAAAATAPQPQEPRPEAAPAAQAAATPAAQAAAGEAGEAAEEEGPGLELEAASAYYTVPRTSELRRTAPSPSPSASPSTVRSGLPSPSSSMRGRYTTPVAGRTPQQAQQQQQQQQQRASPRTVPATVQLPPGGREPSDGLGGAAEASPALSHGTADLLSSPEPPPTAAVVARTPGALHGSSGGGTASKRALSFGSGGVDVGTPTRHNNVEDPHALVSSPPSPSPAGSPGSRHSSIDAESLEAAVVSLGLKDLATPPRPSAAQDDFQGLGEGEIAAAAAEVRWLMGRVMRGELDAAVLQQLATAVASVPGPLWTPYFDQVRGGLGRVRCTALYCQLPCSGTWCRAS